VISKLNFYYSLEFFRFTQKTLSIFHGNPNYFSKKFFDKRISNREISDRIFWGALIASERETSLKATDIWVSDQSAARLLFHLKQAPLTCQPVPPDRSDSWLSQARIHVTEMQKAQSENRAFSLERWC
jgi:hypothetical protein